MVTRIRQGAQPHLYIKEWREHRGLSLEAMGGRLGVEKNTVWRWENEQHRLNPGKQAHIAHALDLEVTDLFRPPSSRLSIDALLRDAPDDVFEDVTDLVKRFLKRAS